MDEKTKLLEQLRIDRGEGTRSASQPRRSTPIWVVYALVLVIVAGIGSWLFLRPHAADGAAAASSAAEVAAASAATDSGGAGTSAPAGSTAR